MKFIKAKKPPEDLHDIRPGKYDMSNAAYHSMKWILSSSGAKTIARGDEIRFNWERTHPQPPTDAMRLGTLWHANILEGGKGIEWIDAPDYRTKTAREARDAAIAEGLIPTLVKEKETLEEVLASVMANPDAAALLNPFEGEAEGSYITEFKLNNGKKTLVRTRPDWITIQDGKLKIVDYKTTESAKKSRFIRSIVDLGYHQQAAWYEETLTAAFKCKRSQVEFWFIAQEKTPPYTTGVYRLDDAAIVEGEKLNHAAINDFERWERDGWPTHYQTDTLSLPNWGYSKEVG
ncbi:PD-(D/E)XK nuclease-like domain-containing protein [Mobiluncus porci]|uniref:Putative exodeoxyribonuclease 8 PDDEXK-like domain-containing protein n=1 Tax=Mobiluncus porci TaxID=2652278 RepID=A0A7K0K0E5_9ACTO|nr:hypothetical protein [Mobiluncus porci]